MGKSEIIAGSPLFAGSTPGEIDAMLECLKARERRYKAGARIHRMGDVISTVGFVLEGCVRIENVNVWGSVNMLGTMESGDMFGAAYAAVPGEPMLVDVVAVRDSKVLFLDLAKVLTTCPRTCPHHCKVSANMVATIARRNIEFSRRIFHMAPKTIRGKVLAYLSDMAERAGSREFDIPFDRQQLAGYLGVDRSALSAELSRMQKAGLIETHRSHFMLK